MLQIDVKDVTKVYRTALRPPGFGGALRHLLLPKYDEWIAVHGLDLEINAGDTVALVGPNGAGKSTTIKMLTGVLVPSSGHIRVAGIIPHSDRIRNAQQIGVVFGQRTQLWWDLSVLDSLELQSKIYGISAAAFRDNMMLFRRLLDLDGILHLTARKLSLGQRMRADLVMALLHAPAIVYLDEPTIGLDLTAKECIRAFLKELNRVRGTTILLTTHDLVDMEEICQRIVIIDKGKKIFDGGLGEVKDRFARRRAIRFQLESPRAGIATLLEPLSTVEFELDGERGVILRFDRLEHSASELTRHVMQRAVVVDFHLEEPSIEDVIRQVYSGKLFESGYA
jgi:ABC-2 type transport system ATP-binding protein